jgi:aerobic carbon-monoxide dehydrogenase medium subunit
VIPAAFEYKRPTSIDDALTAIAGGDAKVLAGGQSLLPLLKLRLAHADTLVDIGRIGELRSFGETADGGYEIGAMATYAEIIGATKLGWTAEALEQVGDVQVRNRGTVAGSLAHCDPGSDAPAISLALDYSVVLRSKRGERVVPVDQFFVGPFQTAMEPDEMIVKLRRGPLPAGVTGAYRKLAQPASGYSIVGVAAVIGQEGGDISHARVGITGVGDHPYRATAVEAALLGSDGSPAAVAAAAEHAADGQTVNSDIHADRDYRARMAVVYTRRAIEAALGR